MSKSRVHGVAVEHKEVSLPCYLVVCGDTGFVDVCYTDEEVDKTVMSYNEAVTDCFVIYVRNSDELRTPTSPTY
jgi:hypothetical protein